MTSALFSPRPFTPSAQAPEPRLQVCKHCGGSGILRVSDLSHRTCMECLGQGKSAAAADATWPLAGFSAAVCASGAR